MGSKLRSFKQLLLIGLCFIMLLPAASCGKASETDTTPKDTDQKTEIDVDSDGTGASVESTGEAGDTSFTVDLKEGVTVPKDYPDIVPLYPNGMVTLAGKQDETHTVVIQTSDSIDEVNEFYEENLKLDTVEMKQITDGFIMISGTLDGFYISIMTSQGTFEGEDMNLITIAIMPES